MAEETFLANTSDGPIAGHISGSGSALLLLHGGPALTDYMDMLAAEVDGWRAVRYQQRGLAPSATSGPFTVEQHVADAVAVLDTLRIGRAGISDKLGGVRAPAVLVLGERSPLPVSQGQQVAALLPSAEVNVIPGARHLPWHERPGCVAAALARVRARATDLDGAIGAAGAS